MVSGLTRPQLIKNLAQEDIAHLLDSQVRTANYLAPPQVLPPRPDRTFGDNRQLWNAILTEQIRASMTITLQDFLLFEWFPRSPGLFHRPEAQQHFREAMSCIERETPQEIIFNPYGKMSLLKGGVGNIRLKPRVIEMGKVWFMTASSTPVAHEGFPIALTNHVYQQLIDRLTEEGTLLCSLVGKLQFLPDPLVSLFGDFTGVPQLYLLVEQVRSGQPFRVGENPPLSVSAAVSFSSSYEGEPKMYASFVTFDPSSPGALAKATDWLEETYVRGMYHGKVETNFDEWQQRFQDATFSLQKVMNGQLQASEVTTFINTLHLYGPTMLTAERVVHMTQERVITIGAGAQINAPVVIAESIQNSFNALAGSTVDAELKQLLGQLLKAVSEAGKSAPPEAAQSLARDAEALTKEATSPKPRRRVFEAFLEGIKDVATTIGEVGKPVVEIAAQLAPLVARFAG